MVYDWVEMRKLLIVTAFTVVLAACSTVGEVSEENLETSSADTVAVADTPPSVESPAASMEDTQTMPEALDSTATVPAPTSTARQVLEPTSSGDDSGIEPVLVAPAAAPSAPPEATLLNGDPANGSTGTVENVGAMQIDVSNDFDGAVDVTVRIVFPAGYCETPSTNCRWAFHLSSVTPGSSDFTKMSASTEVVPGTFAFPLAVDDLAYTLTVKWKEPGSTDSYPFPYAVNRLSEIP